MIRTLRVLAAAALALAAVPAAASAQSLILTLDGGQRNEKFGNGDSEASDEVGMAVTMMVGGQSSSQFGFLMPLTAGFRYVNTTGSGFELMGDADMMMRIGPVAAGLGVAMRGPASHSFSWNCTAYEDCPSGGFSTEESDEALMVGLSYSGKVNFGPQGRFFVQGKMADLSTALDTRGGGQSCNDFGCFDTYAEEFLGGRETRIATGFAWRGKVFRVQWVKQKAEYERAARNNVGDMDRESSGWTVGISWYN